MAHRLRLVEASAASGALTAKQAADRRAVEGKAEFASRYLGRPAMPLEEFVSYITFVDPLTGHPLVEGGEDREVGMAGLVEFCDLVSER